MFLKKCVCVNVLIIKIYFEKVFLCPRFENVYSIYLTVMCDEMVIVN